MLFSVLAVVLTTVFIAADFSVWAPVANTFLLIILAVIQNRHRKKTEEAKELAEQSVRELTDVRKTAREGVKDLHALVDRRPGGRRKNDPPPTELPNCNE